MDRTIGYGNTNFVNRGNVPKVMEGKVSDFDQCDSGFDSYNPSLDSERSSSYQYSADMGLTNKFSDLSMSASGSSHIGHQHEDQKCKLISFYYRYSKYIV